MSNQITISQNKLPSIETNELLEPRSLDRNTKGVVSRMEKASHMTAKATPVAQGMYELETNDETYIVNLDSYDKYHNPQPACLCDDFIFRASNDGFDCKHVLYVKKLISNGFLPPVDEEPNQWVQQQLIEYKNDVKNLQPDSNSIDDFSLYHSVLTKINTVNENPCDHDLRTVAQQVNNVKNIMSENSQKKQDQQTLTISQ